MITKLRDIAALLTKVANAPMDSAAHALHRARIDLTTLLMELERTEAARTISQQQHGERVVARQKQNG